MTVQPRDAALAFAFGALIGVGAAILLNADDADDDAPRAGASMHAYDADDRAEDLVRVLRARGFRARIARRGEAASIRAAFDLARRVRVTEGA